MWYYWFSALYFLIAVLLADFAMAAVHWGEMRVKHTWNTVPGNWESLGNTTFGATIKLHIALKPDRESALIDALSEVSNPEHTRYGAYLSKEQVTELVRPHPDTFELVRAWLVHHGIQNSSISTAHGGSWLMVTDVLMSQANQILGASYQVYRNSKTDKTIIRTVGYSLPAVLHTHIRTVAPTTYFPSRQGMRQIPRRRSSEAAPAQGKEASGKVVMARQDPGMTPSVLRWMYKTNAYWPAVPYQNTIGVLGFDEDYPSKLDLTQFMTRYRSDSGRPTFTVIKWNDGEYNPSNPGDFASVGIQYTAAMAYPTMLTFYSVGGDMRWDAKGEPIAGDSYLEWFNNILQEPFLPQTISIIYGQPEHDLPEAYAREMCELFAELGVRGVSVLVASGIDGVGAGDCINPEGNVRFIPDFPASCPYVTSVGGTTRFRPEMAANLSGGGFSFYFERPWYQDDAVSGYFDRRIRHPDDSLYNRHGRGYPDISAQALHYNFIKNDEMFHIDGTTCAVSTVAGIVALIHDFRLSRSRQPRGFLNPWLYFPGLKGFNDVTIGVNPGCNTDGFQATVGWDPVTGLGSLNFTELLTNT